MRWKLAPDPAAALHAFAAAARSGARLARLRGRLRRAARTVVALAAGARDRDLLARAADRAPARRRRGNAPGRPRAARAHRRRLRVARALPDRTHARPARRDERRSRPARPRRGLHHLVDHPLGQGPGVERGARAQRRRRLHPVRHGDRQRSRDRGRAPPALRRDDARPATTCTCSCRSASTFINRLPAAIGMSTRRPRGSFQPSSRGAVSRSLPDRHWRRFRQQALQAQRPWPRTARVSTCRRRHGRCGPEARGGSFAHPAPAPTQVRLGSRVATGSRALGLPWAHQHA